MDSEIKAIFIGEDGSLGFEKDKSYDLITWVKNDYIWIEGTTKIAPKGVQVPYESIKSFLDNWKVIYE